VLPKIRGILYATDLTKNSAYAFRYAVILAQKFNSQIHIMHVLEKLPSSVEGLLKSDLDALQLSKSWEERKEEQIKRIHQRLSEFAKRELNREPAAMKCIASISVVEGDPAIEILQKAEELNCDIVIMGTHGHGLVGHAFLGSVAEKVLHRITKPVFIIPIPKADIDISFRDI
jgi:nucleotide-binding universal stress UspA family protein